MTSPMILIAPGQDWSTVDGDDVITINHSVDSRWMVTGTDGDTFVTTASAIRALYRYVEQPVSEARSA